MRSITIHYELLRTNPRTACSTWAEGEQGRKTDELVWRRTDFAGDGVHLSHSGRQKVAELLLEFFATNPLAKSWFAD